MGRQPGDLYMPSSGSEGDGFTSRWCDQCRRDDPDGPQGGCQILLRATLHDVGEPDYPREWRYGADGNPECTAFAPDGPDEAAAPRKPLPGQLSLFTDIPTV